MSASSSLMARVLASSYTLDQIVEECFPDVNGVNQKVHAEIVPLPNAKSFWSVIGKIRLNWKCEKDQKQFPNSLFIKLPTVETNAFTIENDEHKDALLETLRELTINELRFYENYPELQIPFFPTPKCFFRDDFKLQNRTPRGCLVLEDFSATAAAMDYIPGFTLPQVEALIDAIASFQAHWLKNPGKWSDDFQMYAQSDEFSELMFEEAKSLATLRPEFKGRMEPLKKYYNMDYEHKAILSYKELEIPPVLVHTDMNTTNVLWVKETMRTDKPKISAIIDFQQIHAGQITEDIVRILTLGLSCGERRKHTTALLQRYHRKLTEFMGGEAPFSFEKVVAAYKRVFPMICQFGLYAIKAYYMLYEKIENDDEKRRNKQEELLSRGLGILEDVYTFLGEPIPPVAV